MLLWKKLEAFDTFQIVTLLWKKLEAFDTFQFLCCFDNRKDR